MDKKFERYINDTRIVSASKTNKIPAEVLLRMIFRSVGNSLENTVK